MRKKKIFKNIEINKNIKIDNNEDKFERSFNI